MTEASGQYRPSFANVSASLATLPSLVSKENGDFLIVVPAEPSTLVQRFTACFLSGYFLLHKQSVQMVSACWATVTYCMEVL
eukprot:scaffold37035_cov14-Tisochrysis_lutea.AAC.1